MAAAVQGKRAQRVADTRARIVDSALDLYVSQGFLATTIEQISAVAGISRSSFFNYFATKEAVLFAPFLGSHAWFLDELRCRALGEPPLVRLATVCLTGAWPQIRRHDLLRSRKVLQADPALREALVLELGRSAYPGRLIECLSDIYPALEPRALRVITDISISWMSWAITAYIKDGRSLTGHFAAVIGSTVTLAADLVQLPEDVLGRA